MVRLDNWRQRIVLPAVIVSAMSAASCAEPPSADAGPADIDYAARLIERADLDTRGFGRVRFEARDGKELDALLYRAQRFDPVDGPIWFIMHGVTRDVERYIRTAAPAAERYDALAVAIHFSKDAYPRSTDYTLGLTENSRWGTGPIGRNRWRNPENYPYAELGHLFESIRHEYGGRQQGYFVFGHSAGAQFAHRLATFQNDAPVLGVAAANAGWYTLPVAEPRAEFTMPYGLHGSPMGVDSLERLLGTPLTVLVGEHDTALATENRLVRATPEAMAQGEHRLARARHYFETGASVARERGEPFNWQFAVVPQAGHSAAQMIDSAANVLFASEPLCDATLAGDADGLTISEILADPPAGDPGDANRDGRRDPAEDEFVEIVNTGPYPVCLAGWTLGDASDKARHVFPLGTELAAGGAIVVFGGGIPSGDFGGVEALTARFGGRLSLTNDGDVLTLGDPEGTAVVQVSWGDCAGAPCAADHIAGSLELNASSVRVAASVWQPHDGLRYSPGRRADGSLY